MIEANKINKEETVIFFNSVEQFYSAACSYITKCPVNNEMLSHAEVADIELRQIVQFSSVKYFDIKFPSMLQLDDTDRSYKKMEQL